MNQHWLEITQAGRKDRHALQPAGLSIGGGNAQLPIQGVGADQLVLVPDPWRVTFQGTGAPPFCAGAPLSESALTPGMRIEWAGVRIEFREQARLEELPLENPEVLTLAARDKREGLHLSPIEANAWQRVRAGLLVDTGQIPRAVVKEWQEQVLEGPLDINGCAQELNALIPELPVSVAERAGRLMRDFLMASKLQGASGAARASRKAARSLAGLVISQSVAIVAYSLIVFGCMLFIRRGGTSFDGLFDSILGFFGAK